ncbi:MAG: peptidase T [Chitinophagia bacterium]|jgi:tripeptide aminopeptidase
MRKHQTYSVAERMMRYVMIDTTSDPASNQFPSSEKQLNLSRLLVEELKALGVGDVILNEDGYVIARIPSNVQEKVPVLCFCSHVDTAPDCSGTGVKPILHTNYTGADILLPDDPTQIINVTDYPYLKNHIGKSIITASGTTLLGADDKSGVAIIMDTIAQLQQQPQIPHGELVIVFTPDEETGRGTEKLSVSTLGANVGYTLDGGELGSYEEETFSADEVKITIEGVMAHPGYAKGKMVNAIPIAAELITRIANALPVPEQTENREGFVHPHTMEGNAEKVTIRYLIRDFEVEGLIHFEEKIQELTNQLAATNPGAKFMCITKEQYRNMKPVVDQYPEIFLNTRIAFERAGIDMQIHPVRGGTDGSRLSYMGLPCSNIFTGMQAIHSKHEWIGVADMERAVDVLIELVQVWSGK